MVDVARRSPNQLDFTIHDFSTTTISVSGNSSDIDVSPFNMLHFLVYITAVTGTTPSMQLIIEAYNETLEQYTQLYTKTYTAVTSSPDSIIIPNNYRFLRARWVVTGTTPVFTGKLVAQGHANATLVAAAESNLYVPVHLYTSIAGERRAGYSNSYMQTRPISSFLQGNTSQKVLDGAGWMTGLFISSAAAATVIVYDSTTASGTVVLNTFVPVANQYIPLHHIAMTNGIYIAVTGTVEYTVFYDSEA